jgi:hypothetical protein
MGKGKKTIKNNEIEKKEKGGKKKKKIRKYWMMFGYLHILCMMYSKFTILICIFYVFK